MTAPHMLHVVLDGHPAEAELPVELLTRVSPIVAVVAPGEAYVDLQGCERIYGTWSAAPLGRLPFRRVAAGVYLRQDGRAIPPADRAFAPDPCRWITAVAAWTRRAIQSQTGRGVSAGCAANTVAARAASALAGADGLALVLPGAEADFFLRLRLEDVPGLSATVRLRLARWNARTVAAARRIPIEAFGKSFGARAGRAAYLALRGEGEATLRAAGLPPPNGRQGMLFDDDRERRRRLVRCLDGLRDRFGSGVVQRNGD